MGIQIRYEKEIPGVRKRIIRQKLKMVLEDLGCNDKEVSILFTDDENISKLNEYYLHRKGPTNVIAFPLSGEEESNMGINILGDVVISVDTAVREAEEMGEDVEDTIYRLLVHGILHLLGYDHERDEKGAKEMEKQEKRLLSMLKEK